MAKSVRKTSLGGDAEFARLATIISKDPRVDPPDVARAKGFGSKGLKVARKLFAFVSSKGTLVVKLPTERVDKLVSSGKGRRFEPAPGRVMKEWLAVDPGPGSNWLPLAREALEFTDRGRKQR
jgi:hypothetical protein